MVTVNWAGGMAFEADPPSGNKFTMDSHPDFGGTNLGPSPVETLLSALGACSAIDVLSILQKKHQRVTAYRIEVDGERPPHGTFPRPFNSLVIRHIVTGVNIDPAAVDRAVQLSDDKYCSVIATLRAAPEVTSEFRIEEATPALG
jgi:putative redox protein